MLKRFVNFAEAKFSQVLVVLVFLMSLGYLSAYLKFAKPRGFGGDFYAAMFSSKIWDGSGIFYGPIFVFERWIVDGLSSIATIQFFAIGSLVLISLSLLLTIRIGGLQKKEVLYCLVVWTFNSYLYYSFSVVSNPELIQLFFLILMWWALTNRNYKIGWIAITLAALTKLVPLFLFPVLLLFFSWTGLVASVLIVLVALILLSIGQGESIFSLISQSIAMNTSASASNTSSPQPDSEQFLGLSSAIARFLGMQPGQDFKYITGFSNLLILVLYVIVLVVSLAIYRSKILTEHEVFVAYVFALFMALLPMLHLSQVHRHTFIYLTPVWIALRIVYSHDESRERSRRYMRLTNWLFIVYSFIPIYFLDIYNVNNSIGSHFGSEIVPSLLMLTEPVWLNLFLLFSILYYGISRIREVRRSQNISL
jgi:hypothetical protein